VDNGKGNSARSFLIVNADDFGYFDCVNEGIIQAHTNGIVTATGLFGNAPTLSGDIDKLKAVPGLDVGVHLNLTFGAPVTPSLQRKMNRFDGKFPSKTGLLKLLLRRVLTTGDIEKEWAAQIENCQRDGLNLQFLNSHEHVHMLPGLNKIVHRLASRYGIRHVRTPAPDSLRHWRPGTLLRDLPLSILSIGQPQSAIGFAGMGESGRLSLAYLSRRLRNLRSGAIVELMCHPGILDPDEVNDPTLLEYHDWEQERELLTSSEAKDLLGRYDVGLIGFRDVDRLLPSSVS